MFCVVVKYHQGMQKTIFDRQATITSMVLKPIDLGRSITKTIMRLDTC